uniref:F-box domain-containing protein n=1 Tax=Panagrellus redivivus TaxID=6233 RepID=A0A7E4ZUE4_PANRE
MSSNITNNVIQHFTYDWLIRFMELTPEDANPNLGDISPLFNECAKKYAPRFLSSTFLDQISDCVPSNFKGKVIITDCVSIKSSQELAKLKRPNIHFHISDALWLNIMNLEFFDFKRVLGKSIKNRVVMSECQFASPVLFSELLPLVYHCEKIMLEVRNLHYDASNAVSIYNCPRLEHLELHHLPASEAFIHLIVDFCLTSKCDRLLLLLYFNEDANIFVVRNIAALIRYKISTSDIFRPIDYGPQFPSRDVELILEYIY